jgi:hypothetical protein
MLCLPRRVDNHPGAIRGPLNLGAHAASLRHKLQVPVSLRMALFRAARRPEAAAAGEDVRAPENAADLPRALDPR